MTGHPEALFDAKRTWSAIADTVTSTGPEAVTALQSWIATVRDAHAGEGRHLLVRRQWREEVEPLLRDHLADQHLRLIFNTRLDPRQLANLEDALDVRT